MTCLMMSRTFLEEEQIKEVIVPMPSFDSRNRRPLAKTVEEKARVSTSNMTSKFLICTVYVASVNCLCNGIQMQFVLGY